MPTDLLYLPRKAIPYGYERLIPNFQFSAPVRSTQGSSYQGSLALCLYQTMTMTQPRKMTNCIIVSNICFCLQRESASELARLASGK